MFGFKDAKFKLETEKLNNAEKNKVSIEIDTTGMDKWQADLLALNALTSDADVSLTHEGKQIPTLKQVISNVINKGNN